MDQRVFRVQRDGPLYWIVLETIIYDDGNIRVVDSFGPFDEKYRAEKEAEARQLKADKGE
jgi:hypothetical protein